LRTKYNNKKTIVDGYSFSSKLEAKHYNELKLLLRAGYISALTLQKAFILQDKFKHDGKTERAITYICDFYYIKDGKEYAIDSKGFKTEVYKIKRKLFLFKYPHINFQEITK